MLTSDTLLAALARMVQVIIEEAPILGDLDAAIGDGDHGVNMVVGFRAVEEEYACLTGQDIESILGHIGTTLMAAIGGASGPLYNSAFTEAAKMAGPVYSVGAREVAAMLNAARDGVARRGRSCPGEKTMLDTLEWAAREARNCALLDIPARAVGDRIAAAAAGGMLSTRGMIAQRGRARSLRERTVDHLDPGAASCYLLIATLCGHRASLASLARGSMLAGNRVASDGQDGE